MNITSVTWVVLIGPDLARNSESAAAEGGWAEQRPCRSLNRFKPNRFGSDLFLLWFRSSAHVSLPMKVKTRT